MYDYDYYLRYMTHHPLFSWMPSMDPTTLKQKEKPMKKTIELSEHALERIANGFLPGHEAQEAAKAALEPEYMTWYLRLIYRDKLAIDAVKEAHIKAIGFCDMRADLVGVAVTRWGAIAGEYVRCA